MAPAHPYTPCLQVVSDVLDNSTTEFDAIASEVGRRTGGMQGGASLVQRC